MAKFVRIDTNVIYCAVKAAIANGRPQDAIKYLDSLIPEDDPVKGGPSAQQRSY